MILKFLVFGIWTIAANILFLNKSSAHFSWPQGRIPYLDDFALTANPDQSVALNNARMDLQVRSCIKFIPRRFEKDFVFFTDLGPQVECWNMFDQTKGRIEVNAGPSCLEPMRKPYRPKQVFSDCDIEYVNHLYNCPRRRNHVSPICPLGQNIMAFPETTTKVFTTASLSTELTTKTTTTTSKTTIIPNTSIETTPSCTTISTTIQDNVKESTTSSIEYYVDDNVNNLKKKHKEFEEINENGSYEFTNLEKDKNFEKNSFEIENNIKENEENEKEKTSFENYDVQNKENSQNEEYFDEDLTEKELDKSNSLISKNKNAYENSFEKENNTVTDNYYENDKLENSEQLELINYDNEDEKNLNYETTEETLNKKSSELKISIEETKNTLIETNSDNFDIKTSTDSLSFLSTSTTNIPRVSGNYWSLTPSTLLSMTLITNQPTVPTLKPFLPDWVKSVEESFEKQEKIRMNKHRFNDFDDDETKNKNPRIAIEIIEGPRSDFNNHKNKYISNSKKNIHHLFNIIKKNSDEIMSNEYGNENDNFGIQRTKVITTIEKTNYIGSCGSACLYSGDLIKLYRSFYEKPDGKINHFYTTDRLELHFMASQGYVIQPSMGYLGQNHIDPTCSCLKPLYRLYNDFMKDHLLTSTEQEKDIAERLLGYKFEKILGFCTKEPGCGAYMPLYRFYNAIAKDHLYTVDQQQMNYYKTHPELAYGFEYIECYVWQHNSSVKDCPAITISVPNKNGFARF